MFCFFSFYQRLNTLKNRQVETYPLILLLSCIWNFQEKSHSELSLTCLDVAALTQFSVSPKTAIQRIKNIE